MSDITSLRALFGEEKTVLALCFLRLTALSLIFKVYCLMSKAGGGWTHVMSMVSLSFSEPLKFEISFLLMHSFLYR